MKKSIYWIVEDRVNNGPNDIGEWYRYLSHYADRERAVAFTKNTKNLESRLVRIEVVETETFETP